MRVKCVLFSKVSDHNVRPPDEEEELQGHGKTEAKVVVSSPERSMVVDNDLNACKFKYFEIYITFSESVDELVSRRARFKNQRQV